MIALGGAHSHVFVSTLILGVLCTFCSPAPDKKAGLMRTVDVKLNSSYAILIPVDGTPVSFKKGTESVPKGSPSNHCVEGKPCWELLSDKSYAELKSDKVHENGTIIVTPINRKKSSTKILVRDRNGTSRGLPRSKGVGHTQVLQLDPQRKSSTVLLYNEEVQNTTVSGNIKTISENGGPSGGSSSMLLYLGTAYKGKNGVLLTGYIGANNEEIRGELTGNGKMQILLIGNPDAPDYKTLRVSFQNACAVNTWNVMVYVLSLIVIKANA